MNYCNTSNIYSWERKIKKKVCICSDVYHHVLNVFNSLDSASYDIFHYLPKSVND